MYERQEMVNRCVPYKVLKMSLCIMKSVQDYVRTMLLRRFNKHTALFAEISDRSKYVTEIVCVVELKSRIFESLFKAI